MLCITRKSQSKKKEISEKYKSVKTSSTQRIDLTDEKARQKLLDELNFYEAEKKERKAKKKENRHEEFMQCLYSQGTNSNKKDLSKDHSESELKEDEVTKEHEEKRTGRTVNKKAQNVDSEESSQKPKRKSKKHYESQSKELKNALTIDSEEAFGKPKRKLKKTKAERNEERMLELYPPVTADEEWEREYERALVPTIPHNMSKDEYVRGFFTSSEIDMQAMTTSLYNETSPGNFVGFG